MHEANHNPRAVLPPTPLPHPEKIVGRDRQYTEPALIYRIRRAHLDDIHGLVSVDPGGRSGALISGSKDGAVRRWQDGALDFTFKRVNDGPVDYRRWITSFGRFDAQTIVVGYRDGGLAFLGVEDGNAREAKLEWLNHDEPVSCKARNTSRVMSVSDAGVGTGSPTRFLVGRRGGFSVVDPELAAEVFWQPTVKADWVYCIASLANSASDEKETEGSCSPLVVVTGTELDLLVPCHSREGLGWTQFRRLISQGERPLGQRPFISDICFLPHPTRDRLVAAVFDGSTRVVDVESGTTVFHNDEHFDAQSQSNRVWAVTPSGPETYFSCGDDHTVRLYDVRVSGSVRRLSQHPGRVSCLLLDGNCLTVASCSDRPRNDFDKGQLFAYDLNKL